MPANGSALLDSSVVVPYFRGDPSARDHIRSCPNLYLPQTALGELYCGAHLSANPSRILAQIQNFLPAVTVLSPGVATAEHYGRIRAELARVGTPIPENDIWIAALAVEHQMPLAARDAHFERIMGLQLLKW